MSTIIKNSTKNHLQSIDSYTWIQKLKSELSRQIVNNLTYPTKITVASIAQELHIGEKTLWRKIKEDTKQA
ncbi:MAG: hypothetical protein AB8B69_10450, partial [Chitinophagales bacterium]